MSGRGGGATGRVPAGVAIGLTRGVLGALLVLVIGVGSAEAQDIETAGAMRGVEVPEGYYERLARDPMAFQLPNGLFRAGARVDIETVRPVGGTHRVAVLPALFSDSPEPHITQQMIQATLFDGPAPAGTITEVYAEMSGGALNLIGEVLPWVRTSRPMAEVVGTANGLGSDADLGPYFVEALQASDPDIDFGLYDNDGPDGSPNSGDDDGIVDAMVFEYLEIAGSCGGPSIWPHRYGLSAWNGSAFTTDDPRAGGGFIQINGYITQSVTGCDGVSLQIANVIAHEYGHVLGLPDFYHPTADGGAVGRRWVLGCWELMAGGSWGCGPIDGDRDPFGPTHMSARNKHVLGWLDFTDIPLGGVIEQEFVLNPVQTSGEALRIQMNRAGTEYLIVEFRDQVGFDHQIPASGVLVYHQDLEASTRPDPTGSDPYFLALLEQDHDDGLVRNTFEGGDRGVPGDAWGVGGVVGRIDAVTSPNTRLNNGAVSPITFHSIVVENGQARIVLTNEVVIEEDRLIELFLRNGAQPLTDVELSYLDGEGNKNGRYDVGDLRKWLRLRGG